MNVKIYSHYTGTTNGLILDDGQIHGGYFYPEGDGALEAELEVVQTGSLSFDPQTGKPINEIMATWEGTDCGVTFIERSGGNGTRVVPAIWISAKDRNGTVHTQEFPFAPGEVAFGFLTVVVE